MNSLNTQECFRRISCSYFKQRTMTFMSNAESRNPLNISRRYFKLAHTFQIHVVIKAALKQRRGSRTQVLLIQNRSVSLQTPSTEGCTGWRNIITEVRENIVIKVCVFLWFLNRCVRGYEVSINGLDLKG